MLGMLHRRLFAPALALICAAALSGCAREQAPAVEYTLLDGQKISSKQWAGKVMVVNFWATSCATCVKEMPQIVATHEKYKARGLELPPPARRPRRLVGLEAVEGEVEANSKFLEKTSKQVGVNRWVGKQASE